MKTLVRALAWLVFGALSRALLLALALESWEDRRAGLTEMKTLF